MHKCCVAQRGLYATEVNKASDFVSDGIANSLTGTPHPACFVARGAPLDNIHGSFQSVIGARSTAYHSDVLARS